MPLSIVARQHRSLYPPIVHSYRTNPALSSWVCLVDWTFSSCSDVQNKHRHKAFSRLLTSLPTYHEQKGNNKQNNLSGYKTAHSPTRLLVSCSEFSWLVLQLIIPNPISQAVLEVVCSSQCLRMWKSANIVQQESTGYFHKMTHCFDMRGIVWALLSPSPGLVEVLPSTNLSRHCEHWQSFLWFAYTLFSPFYKHLLSMNIYCKS